MKLLAAAIASLALMASVSAVARELDIKRNGSRPSNKGPAETLTGAVRVDPLFAAQDPSRASGGSVTFEPGARSACHTHPRGRILIVIAGSGWVQRLDGPRQEIKPGDVVWIPSGVKPWHGATASTAVTHFAIQEHEDGKVVDWLEKVSDGQYGR